LSYICPLCNGLIVPAQACPHCLQGLSECGKLDDYTGPYSPYTSGITSTGDAEEAGSGCIHVLYCDHCQTRTLWSEPLWDISGNL